VLKRVIDTNLSDKGKHLPQLCWNSTPSITNVIFPTFTFARARDTNFGWASGHSLFFDRSRSGAPKLGYMYTLGYICPSEGVHLWLAIEGQNIFIYHLFPNIYTFIKENNFQKSLYAYCLINLW